MRRLALIILAASTLLAGAAQADPALDGFRNFCVANRGLSASALAAADAAGWQPVPQQLISQLPQSDFQGAQGRMQPFGSGALLLLTANGNMPNVGPIRVCAIAVVPAGASDLNGQLQAFAAVPAQAAPTTPNGFYIWRDDNGSHIPVDRSVPGALIASTTTTPQMTMIVLMSAAQ